MAEETNVIEIDGSRYDANDLTEILVRSNSGFATKASADTVPVGSNFSSSGFVY